MDTHTRDIYIYVTNTIKLLLYMKLCLFLMDILLNKFYIQKMYYNFK